MRPNSGNQIGKRNQVDNYMRIRITMTISLALSLAVFTGLTIILIMARVFDLTLFGG